METWAMAWRNVWRQRRRSWVTIAAMAFALFVELSYSGLVPGLLRDMEEDLVSLELADVQLSAPGWRDRPAVYLVVPRAAELLEALERAGLPAAPRLYAGALAASGEHSAGVMLRGLEPGREARVGRLHEHLQAGDWLDPADPLGVVLGAGLARALGASPGSELVVLGQAADGSLANELYHVRGVLAPVSAGDRSALYLLASSFRELMVLPPGAAHVLALRRGSLSLDEARRRAAELAPGLEVRTWRELNPTVAQMLDSSRGMTVVIFLLLYVAVGILVLDAMLAAVYERVREFGLLKALGAGPGTVLGLVLAESALMLGVASLIGGAAAVPVMLYLAGPGIDVGALGGLDTAGIAVRSTWHALYSPGVVAVPLALLWGVGLLAVLPPAIKAARLDPVDALHHH